jgi:hypothetical protein
MGAVTELVSGYTLSGPGSEVAVSGRVLNVYREDLPASAFQLMQLPTSRTWKGRHIFCHIQRAQLGKQRVGVRGLNAVHISALKESLQSSVLE